MPTVALKTLGCKLNQYESEQMREQLLAVGFTTVSFDSPADLYLINSCTVTHQADRDTRRLARRAKRLNPQARVIVTGCYAETSAAELEAVPEIDLIGGMEAKERIADIVVQRGWCAPGPGGAQDGCCAEALPDTSQGTPPLLHGFAGHTRCYVKVQEGCNARCSYCIIPQARGPSRSVPVASALEQARTLARAGHPEIVLIGTHLGQFGQDLPVHTGLVALMRQMIAIPELQRLRLSSIEPCEVNDELIGMLATEPRLCRHLHIPLQSGCDAVLRRMNRPYDTRFYAELMDRMVAVEPATGIGADVIVGFPGETDEEFEQTRRFVENLPLSYLHVFTYSPRRGTPAAGMPDSVAHEIAVARNHVLQALSVRKRGALAERMVGATLGVVLQTDDGSGWLRGVTDNYLQMGVEAPSEMLQRLVTCRVTGAEDGELVGVIA